MTDIIVLVILLVIVGAAGWYVHKEKKRGVKCIGCPEGCSCASGCNGSCGGCGGSGAK